MCSCVSIVKREQNHAKLANSIWETKLLVVYYLLLLLVCCQIVGKVLKIKSCIEVFDEFFCFSSARWAGKKRGKIKKEEREREKFKLETKKTTTEKK